SESRDSVHPEEWLQVSRQLARSRIGNRQSSPRRTVRPQPPPGLLPAAVAQEPGPLPRHVPAHDYPDQAGAGCEMRGNIRYERRQIACAIYGAEVREDAIEHPLVECGTEILHSQAVKLYVSGVRGALGLALR